MTTGVDSRLAIRRVVQTIAQNISFSNEPITSILQKKPFCDSIAKQDVAFLEPTSYELLCIREELKNELGNFMRNKENAGQILSFLSEDELNSIITEDEEGEVVRVSTSKESESSGPNNLSDIPEDDEFKLNSAKTSSFIIKESEPISAMPNIPPLDISEVRKDRHMQKSAERIIRTAPAQVLAQQPDLLKTPRYNIEDINSDDEVDFVEVTDSSAFDSNLVNQVKSEIIRRAESKPQHKPYLPTTNPVELANELEKMGIKLNERQRTIQLNLLASHPLPNSPSLTASVSDKDVAVQTSFPGSKPCDLESPFTSLESESSGRAIRNSITAQEAEGKGEGNVLSKGAKTEHGIPILLTPRRQEEELSVRTPRVVELPLRNVFRIRSRDISSSFNSDEMDIETISVKRKVRQPEMPAAMPKNVNASDGSSLSPDSMNEN